MASKQLKTGDVIAAVHQTLYELYGEDVTVVLMWLPPGAKTMDLASNADRPRIIRALRQAADNMELGPREIIEIPVADEPAESPPSEAAIHDPEASPELAALQTRYQDAIGRALLSQLAHREPMGFLALINALGHHLALSIRALDEAGSLTSGAKERVLKRLELALRQNP